MFYNRLLDMARSEQQQPPPQHELPLLQQYTAYDYALHTAPFYGQQAYAALPAQRLSSDNILGPFATSNYLHNPYHPVPSVYGHLAATSFADATARTDTAIAPWQQPHESLLHSLSGGEPASRSSSLSQHWQQPSSSHSPPQHYHELDYARYYGLPDTDAANLHVHDTSTEQKLSQHGHHHQGHHVNLRDSLLLDSSHSRGPLPFFAPSHVLPSHPQPDSLPKAKRPKRKKDQDEPKRPLTAYNIFFRDERARLLKKAAEEAKVKAEAEAAEMKEISEERKLDASARSTVTTETNGSGKKVRRRRRRNGRETHGLMSFEEMARKVSKKWHETTDEIKEKYQVLADEDRDRYDREKTAYLQKKKAKRDEDSSSQKAKDVSKSQAG
ncbi:MAG: high mobility group box domain-containing protein [Nitrososphaerota archaeon]|nr:high mobility group box domain-containing protein [Nitrososphaerota archaeon]